ncbi:MgtC/SapB family protein [Crocosphaera sp. UHCC 0190]|uniref:MgtC/SapB family protein n=1 Tax=Crocosphaera sp. UHCC 0190 TaxID=3110246 RepID=UPI002B1F97CC|nr:MgtC/SapB family protein [Crocosphaera sp. UHCC 0190]MEA5509254.1 MgtC/SapB family protein [Crocosphaera sp. UHCC 0190]
MIAQITNVISPEVFKILLVFFLSFLIGLEREEWKLISGKYSFGGVRTYPLIGLIGYSMASLSSGQMLPLAAGFTVIGGLMMLSYWHKMQSSQDSGLTNEMAGLATYVVGALVYHEQFWIASTLVIISLLLLELKSMLEGLAHRFSSEDILTFTKFLFLTAVILPILPNRAFGTFEINPFKTWLIVVAVSSISYGSFLLQKVFKNRGGIALIALLGGAYSSTVTTVALAKQSTRTHSPHRYAGGILMASGIMYIRLAILINLFNQNLGKELTLPFGFLAVVAVVVGWFWSSKKDTNVTPSEEKKSYSARNPLELKAAFLFAFLFVVMVIVTHYTALYLGSSGLYVLGGIMGVTDVDPFILGITQSAGQSTSLSVASGAILIAAASNNLIKGIYAMSFGDQPTGRQSFFLLLSLAILGLIPIIFIHN